MRTGGLHIVPSSDSEATRSFAGPSSTTIRIQLLPRRARVGANLLRRPVRTFGDQCTPSADVQTRTSLVGLFATNAIATAESAAARAGAVLLCWFTRTFGDQLMACGSLVVHTSRSLEGLLATNASTQRFTGVVGPPAMNT